MKKFARENRFPVDNHRCPNSQTSQRQYLKGIIRSLKKRSPNLKKNLFRSITRIKADYINL